MNKVDFKEMASILFFSGGKSFVDYLRKEKIQFRKNKSVEDINNAIKKSLKNSRGKTEYEIGFLEIYLKNVFKTVKGAR